MKSIYEITKEKYKVNYCTKNKSVKHIVNYKSKIHTK